VSVVIVHFFFIIDVKFVWLGNWDCSC